MRTFSRLIVVSAIAAALAACGGDTATQAAKDVAGSAGDTAKAAAAQNAVAGVKEGVAGAKEGVAGAKEGVADAKEGAAGAGDAVAAAVASAEPDLAAGEQTYGRFCFSCHAAGVAGAPKMGVAEDWAPRAAKGLEAMVASTIEGIPPGMPARGLCMNCSDEDLRNTVAWMTAQQ